MVVIIFRRKATLSDFVCPSVSLLSAYCSVSEQFLHVDIHILLMKGNSATNEAVTGKSLYIFTKCRASL